MNIIISTVARKFSFLDITIETVKRDTDQEITLIVGGDNTEYVEKHDAKKVFIGEEEKKFQNIQKAAYGYYKALTLDTTQPALILEDDVMLKEGWSHAFQSLLAVIPSDEYIISFITPFDNCVSDSKMTTPSLQGFIYNAILIPQGPGKNPHVLNTLWCNTSATYYSLKVLQSRLPEFVYKYAVEGQSVYDLAIGKYLFEYNIPIYIAIPNLAKNIGNETFLSAMGNPEKRGHADYSDWKF